MARIIEAFAQFFDGSGDPLVDGFLKFNVTGTNNTDKATFADISETIANANPLQLDGEGRCPNVFGSGSYNVVSFKDSIITPGTPGEQIQQFDPVGGSLDASEFSDWNASTIYSIGDIVTGSDGKDYRSITNANQGNDPTLSATNWKQLQLGQIWNANVTYISTDSVYGSDGFLYFSRIASNIGNDPVSSPDDWERVQLRRIWNTNVTYISTDSVYGSDGLLYFSLVSANLGNDPTTDATSTNWRASDQPRSATAGGTVDIITATYIPAVGALKDGLELRLKSIGKNTSTTPTLNANGSGARTIVMNGNQPLAPGSIGAAGFEGKYVFNTANNNYELLNPVSSRPLLHIQDQKASGTDGGTFTAGAWQTRVLNTVLTNEVDGASLSSNQITLPAGTYYAVIRAPAHRVDRHATRLQNITDASTVLSGSSEFTGGANVVTTPSIIIDRFTLADVKVLEVQHRGQTTAATFGFGVSVGTSFTVDTEIYTDVQIRRVG